MQLLLDSTTTAILRAEMNEFLELLVFIAQSFGVILVLVLYAIWENILLPAERAASTCAGWLDAALCALVQCLVRIATIMGRTFHQFLLWLLEQEHAVLGDQRFRLATGILAMALGFVYLQLQMNKYVQLGKDQQKKKMLIKMKETTEKKKKEQQQKPRSKTSKPIFRRLVGRNSTSTKSHTKQEVMSTLSWSKPKTWSVGDGVINLDALSVQYKQVAQTFLSSHGHDKKCSPPIIESIQRIQNNEMWQCYCTKKNAIETRKSKSPWTAVPLQQFNSEMNRIQDPVSVHHQEQAWLFHGTNEECANTIVKRGFDRAFSKKGSYGKGGVYFAKKSALSCSYAKPSNQNGLRSVFLCRVALGEVGYGTKDQIGPNAKNGPNGLEYYDSAVNRLMLPTTFVVFHDCQHYPEYHIRFKCDCC